MTACLLSAVGGEIFLKFFLAVGSGSRSTLLLAVACGVVAARPVPVPRFASARGRGRWHPVSMPPPPAVPPRFCKKCGVAFQGSKCPASHPIFQYYTRKTPDGVTVLPRSAGARHRRTCPLPS
jgi:hypothetical protein